MIRLDKSKIYIIAIIAIVLIAGIGYAFLSSDLSLNGIINVKKHEASPEPDPEDQPICKRATTLHTEICSYDYPYACVTNYSIGDTITYGNLGTAGTLTAGDAFDCDVNGDGIYNSSNERFYYVSSLDTDSNYGVLIYYNNVSGGEPNNTATYAYDSSDNPRENGPVTLLPQLPTTSQWKNASLSNTTRKIKDEQGTEYIDFSYEGYSARLLTYQEVVSVCGSGAIYSAGYLNSCKYLLENTKYSSNTPTYGYTLENLELSSSESIWRVTGLDSSLNNDPAHFASNGVRPVIEVPKSKIDY